MTIIDKRELLLNSEYKAFTLKQVTLWQLKVMFLSFLLYKKNSSLINNWEWDLFMCVKN